MRCSYSEDDVVLLLKDLTGKLEPLSAEEREKRIQSGTHYCEMLPLEDKPSDEYMRIYNEVLDKFAKVTADAIASLAIKIIRNKGRDVVLVSLARAGIPVGVLLKRYMRDYLNINVDHYAISIIRGRGIDKNAMSFLLERYDAKNIVFVDGWTGKGAINSQLIEALREYPDVSSDLAVVADPAGVSTLYGTRDDILIPNACLNSIVSGLISRTILRDDLISENDFHGYVYFDHLEKYDLTYDFIDKIERNFSSEFVTSEVSYSDTGLDEAKKIAEDYGIKDINFVKPSIGETTRVLLRRIPWKILINKADKASDFVKHVICLANEKHVDIEYVNLVHYKCVGLIKDLADA